MMNFGSALEALKSGETIMRAAEGGHVAYRLREGQVWRLRADDGEGGLVVSTSAQAFGVAEVLSEDWKIAGYEQKGERPYAQEGRPYAGTQEELALGHSGGTTAADEAGGEPSPEPRDAFVEGAHIGVGAGRSG